MLKRLHLKNFTVFADADFEFVQGLNVIVGANGTGKSHVLKLGYAVELAYGGFPRKGESSFTLDKNDRNIAIAIGIIGRLESVFLPRGLNNLVRRNKHQQADKQIQAEVKAIFEETNSGSLAFAIAPNHTPKNSLSQLEESVYDLDEIVESPLFIPAKEILSLMPAIVGVSEQFSNFLDLTYTRLARLLLAPSRKKLPGIQKAILQNLSQSINGAIESEDGRFYLVPEQGDAFEINLVAEGQRKIGMLAHLLSNGSLSSNTTLYWDEPEANLNPALLRELAKVLVELARNNFQIILATHSTDLLKEFHILSRQKDAKELPIKYFGLNAELGEATRIVSTDNFEYLPDVVALEVELKQADQLEEIFIREDQEYHANNRGKE